MKRACLVPLLVFWAQSLCAAPAFIEQAPLWTAGQDGYHTYRIPALLVTAKGSVLAFCEGRKTGSGDHGDVDLIMKRSTDGGRTWSPHRIVHEEGGAAKITIGNPCPVVDAKTGTIWLPFNRDNKAVFITSSTDDGLTWSKPRDISTTTMKPDWDWVATGPGIGIQLTRGPHKGRLVIPSDHKRTLPGKQLEWNSHMMFSDDGGATWQISTPIAAGGNECQVIERTDGSLLVNTRMQGHWQGLRGIATSTDGGATWTAITHEKQLPCPKCQGSLLRYDDQRLLFSNPHPPDPKDGKPSGSRVRLTVRASTDDGKTWPVAKLLHGGSSAYSSLARLADGTVLCLYESGDKRAYDTIRLARFNLEWLLAKAPDAAPEAAAPAPPASPATAPTNAPVKAPGKVSKAKLKPKPEVSAAAYAAHEASFKQLRTGGAWSAVLAQWEQMLVTYGATGVPPGLVEDIEQLRLQLAERPQLATKKSRDELDSLSPKERAEYLVARLHEQRPNHPEDEATQRVIMSLGQDAVPALLAHLRDRRLTRLAGELDELMRQFTVSGGYVFRVQDVALVLLERTTRVTFLEGRVVSAERFRPPLSSREPAEREKLAEIAEAWWAGVGGAPPERWRFEALNRLPLYSRVSEVLRLEQLAPKATNYLAVLQSWTNEVREPAPVFYIRALAERGDASLVPMLRKDWQRGVFRETDLLLHFGSAEDIGGLRDADRRRHLVDPSRLGSEYSFALTQLMDASRNGRAITNRLLVPLLVDQLKNRQPSQTVRVQGEQFAKISRAEAALQALIQLTGHDEGYSLTADFDTRNAVVERWEQWWTKAGEQVWLTLHPETRAAFGTSVTAPAVDDVAALPPLLRVQVAEGEASRFYLMPREQLAAQLRARAVEGRQLGEVTQFRFTSPANEAKWFLQAKPQPTTDRSLTVKLGTSYAMQVGLRRPGLTTNAFLAPSLRISDCRLAIGDSRGRAWMATLAGGTTTFSRHESGQWKTVFTLPAGPSGWSPEHEIQYALPLRDGALLLAIGRSDAVRLHLLHGNEHLEFSNVEALFEREAARLRKLVSYPPDARERAVGLNPNLVLTKDSVGNLWWAKYGKCGMEGLTSRVTATAEELEPGGRSGYFHWLSPLPQTGSVVAAEPGGRVRLLTVDGKRLRAGPPEPLPQAVSSETGKLWPRFLPGRNGGFWVSAKESVMFDQNLKRIASQPGWLVLRDAKEMLWFLDYRHSQDADLLRRDKDGQVSKLHLRGLAGPPCEHGDGSFWVSTEGGLARIVPRAGRLDVVEEALGVGVNHARMWRDPDGLVWVAASGDFRQQLAAYRVRQ